MSAQISSMLIRGRAGLAVNKPAEPVPPGWLWVPVNSVARQETGHTPSRSHPEWWGGDIPWIGIRDARLHHGGVIYDTLQTTNPLGLANSSARLLPKGTVCLSRTASVGYVTIMGDADYDLVSPRMSALPDFIVATHHGAKFSGSVVLPHGGSGRCVVSVGKGNGYGHPSSAAIANHSSAGWSIEYTSQWGAVRRSDRYLGP